jgi:hypothetical protein
MPLTGNPGLFSGENDKDKLMSNMILFALHRLRGSQGLEGVSHLGVGMASFSCSEGDVGAEDDLVLDRD